jgi:hypothetical protein
MGLFGHKIEIASVRYSIGKEAVKLTKSPNAAGSIAILPAVEGKSVTIKEDSRV